MTGKTFGFRQFRCVETRFVRVFTFRRNSFGPFSELNANYEIRGIQVILAVCEQQRVNETQKNLSVLMSQGFTHIVSDEDGSRWSGSECDGLPIESVLGTQFRGVIVVDNPKHK